MIKAGRVGGVPSSKLDEGLELSTPQLSNHD